MMKTIALCMIVKNEGQIIQRCLQSALPLVDYALVVDTGSTDDTPAVVRDFLQSTGLAGQVLEEPWRDFAHNRSFALAKLREETAIDYSLMIDADQLIIFDPDFDVAQFKSGLRCDLYDVKLSSGNVEYLLPQLASNKIEISYRGVLHEFRECPVGASRGLAHGLLIREMHDGGRSSGPRKYAADAELLERALRTETDPFLLARYRFYLAQSYRDAGEPEQALKAYLQRAELGFWDEEVFYSLYSAAKLMEVSHYSHDEILDTYGKAFRACPRRAEAFHGAARFCRTIERYEQGFKFAANGLAVPSPQAGLFVETWIYAFGLLDEYASLAFVLDRPLDCLDACVRILSERKIPEDQRDRVKQTAHFAIEKLDSIVIDQLSDHGESAVVAAPSLTTTRDGISSGGEPISRNALCPCGSGKRYKHCHGAPFEQP
jgi:glycosyltransferase involved in cell wall biosynthesis